MNILWSPLALDRLRGYADYIAQDNPGAEMKWIDSIFDRTAQLSTNPNLGRVVPEFGNPQWRELICGYYRIIYQKTPAQIWILTIRHSRQVLDEDSLGV